MAHDERDGGRGRGPERRGERIILTKSDQAENGSRALFEREDLGRRGPHVLKRRFAGTYSDEE